jgi:hypothetical protein
MKTYDLIEQKINQYIRKYYVNDLIKGVILFFSATLLYFIITTALEYFLWLNNIGRAILFWSFVIFALVLFTRFIIWPISKLLRWTKGIDYTDASQQIGKHFPEVSDKLTNLLQLKSQGGNDELVLAGIEQKAKDLKPVPFQLAIDLSSNLKYLRYAVIPVVIIIAVILFGRADFFTESYKRVVNYQTYYEPPAPFFFELMNKNLRVEEGKPLEIILSTSGEVIPENAKINFNNQSYYLRPLGNGRFSYVFEQVTEDFSFYFSSNGISSSTHRVELIKVPKIIDFSLKLDYPNYTQNKDKTIQGQGSVNIPEGTVLTWVLNTQSTNKVSFKTQNSSDQFEGDDHIFTYNKQVSKNLDYTITTSNQNLKDYENMSYHVKVIKDQYPKIEVEQKKDSIADEISYLRGNINDDYGLSKCRLVYYDKENAQDKTMVNIPISSSNYDQFFYTFPNQNLKLEEGKTYQYYFEVFDNDAIHGSKSSQSQVFGYREKTQSEVDQDLLNKQSRSIDSLNSGLDKLKMQKEDLKEIEKLQKEKQKFNYSDKQKVSNFIKRQKQQRQMMKEYMKSLKESLSKFQPEKNNEEKKALQERIENNERKLQQNEDLLKELEKYQNKLESEELKEKLDKFSKTSKQQERSLEQLLELTKRYYVEQKAQKIAEDLNQLAEEQEALAQKEEDKESEAQKEVSEKFEDLQKELDELEKENEKLKEPMDIERDKVSEMQAEQAQEEAEESLEKSEDSESSPQEQQQQQQNANQQQQNAADKMKQMSKSMAQSMMSMSAQQQAEDAEMLKQILDNLITFSKEQEALMDDFIGMSSTNPNFPKKLRRQGQLRENFEHVDDSLFALALRNPMISDNITSKLTDIQYDIEKSLERLAETQIRLGTTSQQYVMVNANELSNMLDASLDQMQMQMQMDGSGQGKSGKPGKPGKGQGQGKGFQLSDIIKSHEELEKLMQKGQGDKPGEKPGEGKGEKSGGKKPGNQGQSSGDGQGGEQDGKGQDGKQGKSGQNGSNGSNGTDGKSEENQKGSKLSEEMSGELYEIYKQQQQLRDQLEDRIKELGIESDAQNLEKSLDQLEEDMLMQGFSSDVLKQMQNIKHQLLKLNKAAQQQGQENKRQATTNYRQYQNNLIQEDKDKNKEYFESFELLNRQQLPLQTKYKELIKQYFNEASN